MEGSLSLGERAPDGRTDGRTRSERVLRSSEGFARGKAADEGRDALPAFPQRSVGATEEEEGAG